MKLTNWKDTAELIGIAAIVASLIFVGFQLRQDFQIAQSQVWLERDALRAEIAALISDHPDVWVKGLKGTELTESETAQFETMFVLYLQKESTHFFQREAGLSPGDADIIVLRFANMIMTYPGLNAAWTRWNSIRTNPFSLEVDRFLNEMEAGRIEHAPSQMLVPL